MTGIIVHCDWIVDAETELVELNKSKKADSEEEDKKEKDKKLQDNFNIAFLSAITILDAPQNFKSIQLAWFKEINTPPPKLTS